MVDLDGTLFVWRYNSSGDVKHERGIIEVPRQCWWCRTALATVNSSFVTYAGNQHLEDDSVCPLCGWRCDLSWTGDGYGDGPRFATMYSSMLVSEVRHFGVNDPNLPIDEIGAYLKQRFDALKHLDGTTFDRVVRDALEANKCEVVAAAPGFDRVSGLFMFESEVGVRAVDCRWSPQEPYAGVSHVRGVAGATMLWTQNKLLLTPTVGTVKVGCSGIWTRSDRNYEVPLLGATELLRLLDAYSTTLPPLHGLSESDLNAIIAANRARYSHGSV